MFVSNKWVWDISRAHFAFHGMKSVVIMARAPRICTIHGCPHVVTRLNRCPGHARELDLRQSRTTPTKRTRTWAERRRRSARVREHKASAGLWCPGYKRPPHRATDFTAEHVHAVAEGGAPDGVLEVLCRACNSRHGADTLNRLGR